jgi:hypothetical protein
MLANKKTMSLRFCNNTKNPYEKIFVFDLATWVAGSRMGLCGQLQTTVHWTRAQEDQSVRTSALEDQPVRTSALEDQPVRTSALEDQPVRTSALEDQPVRTSALEDQSVRTSLKGRWLSPLPTHRTQMPKRWKDM